MRFSTISLLATSLALTSALPAPGNSNTAPSSTNIEYCESRGLVNALNCIKLLNNLNLDLDILRKREPEAEPNGKSGSKQPSQANVDYCSSQGLLNLANCLDILNDVDIDVSILVKRGRWNDWTDKEPASPTTPPPAPSPTPSPVTPDVPEPEEPEEPEYPGGGWSDEDIEECQSSGLVNVLNCAEILNDLNLDIGILN